MAFNSDLASRTKGPDTPVPGGYRPGLAPIWLLTFALCLAGCSGEERVRTLDPVVVGMTSELEPSSQEGQSAYYEVKAPLAFPLAAPDAQWLSGPGGQNVAPYGRMPWITPDQVRVQLSWTVSNLDAEEHNVRLLVDPWNEFGRYWPGLRVVDAEAEEMEPSLSGIDIYFAIPGTSQGQSSRQHGTFTFEDMEELAADFGTVMAILNDPPATALGQNVDDPTMSYIEHAFQEENRSYDDPLLSRYVPDIIAGLVGVDIGLRTTTPANIALEVVVELVDVGSDRVLGEDSDAPALQVPEMYITGSGG